MKVKLTVMVSFSLAGLVHLSMLGAKHLFQFVFLHSEVFMSAFNALFSHVWIGVASLWSLVDHSFHTRVRAIMVSLA